MCFSDQALQNMSDMELSVGLEAIQREIQKRDKQRRERLIERFHEIWKLMKTAHISITYCEPDEEEIKLYDWDCFSFD